MIKTDALPPTTEELKKRATRRSRVYKVIDEENNPLLGSEEIQLCPLVAGVFCDLDREYLYDKVMIESPDAENESGKEVKYRKRALQLSGMPRVLQCYKHKTHQTHKKYNDETFYVVDYSKRSDIAPGTFTQREIDSGEWLAYFPGISATSRKECDFYGSIVKSQVMAFKIPVGQAEFKTGWQRNELLSKWYYVFRDGNFLNHLGFYSRTNIPIAGFKFADSARGRDWQELMAAFPEPALAQDARLFSRSLLGIDLKKARTLLLCYGAYRGSIHTFVNIEMLTLAFADDSLAVTDGSAGAGKTSSIDFARGHDGPCKYKTTAESKFQATISGTETRIQHLQDTMLSIADCHMSASPSERDLDKFAKDIDTLVSSAADNSEFKPRATRDMEARHGARIEGFAVLDGEKLYPLILSRLRRMALLFFKRGEINTDALHENWQEWQALHTRIGHSVLRLVCRLVNEDETTFKRTVREIESGYSEMLLTRFMHEHPDFDKQLARSLADNYARFLTGARLAEMATGADDLVTEVSSIVYDHLCIQAGYIKDGGASTVDRVWILKETYLILNGGHAHALDNGNNPLKEGESYGLPQEWGHRRGTTSGEWLTQGPHLLNFSKDYDYGYFKPSTWQDELKKRASRQRITWTYNEHTFPQALVRFGIVEPEQGNSKKSAQRPYVAGKRDRRLVVPLALLDVDTLNEATAFYAELQNKGCSLFLRDDQLVYRLPQTVTSEEEQTILERLTEFQAQLKKIVPIEVSECPDNDAPKPHDNELDRYSEAERLMAEIEAAGYRLEFFPIRQISRFDKSLPVASDHTIKRWQNAVQRLDSELRSCFEVVPSSSTPETDEEEEFPD